MLQPCTETSEANDGNGASNGSGDAANGANEGSGRITVHADIVIGADGAGSRTRRLLQEVVR